MPSKRKSEMKRERQDERRMYKREGRMGYAGGINIKTERERK